MSVENEGQVGQFVHHWSGRAGIKRQDTGAMQCKAIVHYEANDGTDIEEETRIYVSRDTYAGSKITFVETGAIDHTDMHIEVSVRWQEFSFDDKSGVLTVRGHSTRFGHDYDVTINPLGG